MYKLHIEMKVEGRTLNLDVLYEALPAKGDFIALPTDYASEEYAEITDRYFTEEMIVLEVSAETIKYSTRLFEFLSLKRGWYVAHKPSQEIEWQTFAQIYQRPCSILK